MGLEAGSEFGVLSGYIMEMGEVSYSDVEFRHCRETTAKTCGFLIYEHPEASSHHLEHHCQIARK